MCTCMYVCICVWKTEKQYKVRCVEERKKLNSTSQSSYSYLSTQNCYPHTQQNTETCCFKPTKNSLSAVIVLYLFINFCWFVFHSFIVLFLLSFFIFFFSSLPLYNLSHLNRNHVVLIRFCSRLNWSIDSKRGSGWDEENEIERKKERWSEKLELCYCLQTRSAKQI